MPYPKANVHPDAQIGKGVVISPFVTIENDVKIGAGTRIGPNATILAGTRLGKECTIHSGAVLGGVPQDLKFEGEYSTLQIGDRTTIRECCTLNRGTNASGTTIVGDDCLIMAYVHIAHDCVIGNSVVLANSVNLAGHVEIGHNAVLGGTSAVHQFVKIGGHVMLSGGSLLRKDVPPYITAARDPVQFMGLNRTGLSRRGFTNEQIKHIDRIYRILFFGGIRRDEAVDMIHAEIPASPERKQILDFLEGSTRGLIRGRQVNNPGGGEY